MQFFSANIQSLRHLYLETLKKALSMERDITKALPDMVEKSADRELKDALHAHLRETEGQARRLQEILAEMSKVETVKCKPMSALIDDAESSIKDAKDENVRDVTIIAFIQQIKHHEIAVYGTLRQWARILGRESDAELLHQTLQEEGHCDHLLTEIASKINPFAEKAA